MMQNWERKLDILGPIDQAARCLDQWLRDENRHLDQKKKQKVAALIARYFCYEDDVTDDLMLSFLRHYSSKTLLDIDDPTLVKQEIKNILDMSFISVNDNHERKGTIKAAFLGATLALFVFLGWQYYQAPINKSQQAELRLMVKQLAENDPKETTASIWADLKQPLRVRTYQEIKRRDFIRVKQQLEQMALKHSP